MLKHQGDLGSVETSLRRGELAHCSEVGEELSSLDELQHDIEVFGVLTDSIGPDVKIKVERV